MGVAVSQGKSILKSNSIFPPQVSSSACSMASLLLAGLLTALVLTQVPAGLADVLEGDSSGKHPYSGSLSLSRTSPMVEGGFFFNPNNCFQSWGMCGGDQIGGHVGGALVEREVLEVELRGKAEDL